MPTSADKLPTASSIDAALQGAPSANHDAARSVYAARIQRVVNYIDAHLADTLDLDTLANVAHFSPFHFHRIFQGFTGETLADCVRRHRLEAAANRLLYVRNPQPAILQIALDVGFASAEVFNRAFKAHFGCTPSAWRKSEWKAWSEKHQDQRRKIRQADSKPHQDAALAFEEDSDIWQRRQTTLAQQGHTMQVDIRQLPTARVAYLRHTGPFGPSVGKAWERFMQWCGAQGLTNPPRTMWGISHDNPHVTAPEHLRYDCCIEVDDKFQAQGEIGVQQIVAGKFACMQFKGTPYNIGEAWTQLYGQWLPASGYQPDNFSPPYELYGDQSEADPKTGVFVCLLCAPVKPL
jgi:AraC family transcriptional regulator